MSNTRQFEGKVIIVTGAGSGMGADTAILLAERGAKVALAGRREAPLRDVEATILAAGGQAVVITADVSKPDDATRIVAETVKHFGRLDGAVNNAGIASESYDLPDLPYELWETTIETNLSSIFYCMRAQLPEIEKTGGGAIVNVSSVFADRGLPMRAAYSASKHGIRGITRSSALDWAARGIRINELQPGVIDTPMISQGGEQENEQIKQSIAAKRMGSGREIATAVAFLLSEDASYVVGAHLAVDGGFLA